MTFAGLARTYLARDEGVRYDWRAGVAAGVAVGVPAIGGVAVGDPAAGVLAALGAWLLLRTSARGTTTKDKIIFLVRRCLLMTAGLVLGLLFPGWAAIPLVAVAALGAPVAALGPFPALCVVIGAQLHTGQIAVGAVLFLAGTLFAAAFLLIPSSTAAGAGAGTRVDGWWKRTRAIPAKVRAEAREGTPRIRYAVRLSACVTIAYVVMMTLHITGAQLVVIGIVTTLLPSWAHTTRRVVKRMVGTVIGCLLAAALLAFAAGYSPYVPVVAVTLLTAVGQPLRQINYGFFAITSSPIALLLTDFNGTVGWREALERSTYSAGGAVLAVLATLLIWPSREEARLGERLSRLLESHARLLDQTAHPAADPGNAAENQRLRTAAEATARDLDLARHRLGLQRKPSPELRTALAAAATTAQQLRAALQDATTAAEADLSIAAGRLRTPSTVNAETPRPDTEPAEPKSVPLPDNAPSDHAIAALVGQLATHAAQAVHLTGRPAAAMATA